MAETPKIRSKEQIIGDLVDSILARIKTINDLNKGSVLSQIIEGTGQNIFSSSASLIAMIDALSVDRAEGEALQRLARDKNVPILPAFPSNGRVDITDISFEKVSTIVYSGQPAPVAGSLKVYVVDASKFNSSGQIYIGRGTTNVEGPLTYTAITSEAGGAYWSLTLDPTTPTTKFHNIGETITLAQGGTRFIPSGTVVQTSQGSSVTSVSFSTTSDAIIIDGEIVVKDVPVICSQSGTIGNVARGSITEAVGLPFDATVFNNIAFSNGKEADTDEDIRSRIKAYEQAKSKGTELAIKVASIGVVAPDELKKVKSSSVIRYTDSSSALVFDDGSGYEPNFKGATFETVVDSAIGGEKEFQLRQRALAQARVLNNIAGPYPIEEFSWLVVEINGIESKHQFISSDFKVPSAATPFEIAASINGDPNITFLCSTAENGTKLVLYPRDRSVDSIVVKTPASGLIDANEALGFPLNSQETLRLYRNSIPLYQNGLTARVTTRAKSGWSPSIVDGVTLIYEVDGAPAVTTTFTLSDFQEIDISATVSSTTSIDIWAQVMNNIMPGITATVNGDSIDISSNLGNSSRASINIIGGTLKDLIFNAGEVVYSEGRSPDYTLNRQTGQLSLSEPLQPGDNLTAGSQFTRGKILTDSLPSGPVMSGRAWFIVDGNTLSIPNGINPATQISFSKTGTKLTITGIDQLLQPEGFEDVKEGDWILVWANPTDPAPLQSNQGFWRVESAQTGSVVVDDGPTARANLNVTFTPVADRIVVVRSHAPIQALNFTSGTLSNFLSEISNQLLGVNAEIVGSTVRISTKTFGDNGQITVIAADNGGSALGLPIMEPVSNTESHYGFSVTSDSEANIPSFTHSVLGSAYTDKDFDDIDYLNHGGTGEDFLEILEKYDAALKKSIAESNKGRRAFVTDFDKALLKLSTLPPKYMQTGNSVMQQDDRYFLRSPYRFDSADLASVISDGDTTTKIYTLPISRKLTVSAHSAPTTQTFSADDAESSLDLNDQVSFKDFDFANFKIFRQAQTLLTDGTYSVRIKNVDFGPSGNMIRAGIYYPETPDSQDITHKIEAGEVMDIKLFLPASNQRTANWDSTTCFTVSKTTSGAKDIITYTWRAGTQPDFVTALVSAGDIVFISTETNFLPSNEGIRGRVLSVTATSFTIEIPNSSVVNDEIAFDSIVYENGIITITTPTPHQLAAGHKIGLWNTGELTVGVYPFNGSYTVDSIISPTSFTIATNAIPNAKIQAASYVNDLIEVTTQTPHGLYAGNIINISGASAPFNGLAPVWNVVSATKFQFMKHHTSSASIGAVGRVDFQSYTLSTGVASISTISKVNGLVTVNATAHGFNVGDIVELQSVSTDVWSNAVTYNLGNIINYSGQDYMCVVASSLNQQPDINPAVWTSITGFDLNGRYIVYGTPSLNQFTFYHHYNPGIVVPTISANATGGTATRLDQVGSMARGIAGTADENLKFYECSTTAQLLVDYISSNLSDKISAAVANGNPTAPIAESTEDLDIGTNYLSASISSVKAKNGSREVEFRTGITLIPKGSHITVSGLTLSQYNGSFIVLDSFYDPVLSENIAICQSNYFSFANIDSADSGAILGSTPGKLLEDGDNSVKISNLAALLGSPKFTAKKAWINPPTIGEEVRLVTLTAEQLVRFWNRLVVTGLSNVSKIEGSEYGRQIQLTTNTFGAAGSIQVVGGTANKLQIAAAGSSLDVNGKFGLFTIPFEIRKGLVSKQWINVKNTVRQSKAIGFDSSTSLGLTGSTVTIASGSGSFQTVRPTAQANGTKIKVEKHGQFVAFISIDVADFGLGTAGVKEGDWVKIRNIDEPTWLVSTTYNAGDRVNYNGINYTSLTTNIGSIPESNPTDWERQEFAQANEGIFQVVRTFGENTFWIEYDNAVEEIMTLGNANNITFYSYDSIMPGDTLIINSDILGAQNVGRYIVADETVDPSFQFPTATTIYVEEVIPNPPVSPVTLGGEYIQVSIEESEPLSLWKKIVAVGPAENSYAAVIVDSPDLAVKISSSLGAYIDAKGKLEFPQSINFGVDAYKYYIGLIKELNRIIYGDPSSPISYPGIRAAGTKVDIKEAIIRRIKASFSIRIKTGIPFSEVRDRVKAAVAGYVNDLGVGESVSISRMIAAANSIPGVVAVAVTSPTYDSSNDLITVGADEKPYIVDPTIDVTISVIGM